MEELFNYRHAQLRCTIAAVQSGSLDIFFFNCKFVISEFKTRKGQRRFLDFALLFRSEENENKKNPD